MNQVEPGRAESLKTHRGLGGKETTQAQPWRSAGPPDREAEANAVQFPWGKGQQEGGSGELQAPPEARHQQSPMALHEQLATILIYSPNE